MSEWAPRRFYEQATATEVKGGHGIALDGRRVMTPGKSPLVVPTRPLAEAIAAEWQAQDEKIDPNTMPFTRTANSAIEKVAPQRAEVAQMLAEYGDSDLLCYRADGPEALVERQAEQWDPMLDWAEATHGARLAPRAGIMHAPQDGAALDRLAARVHEMDAFELAAFHDLVSLTGSLVLGFAAFLTNLWMKSPGWLPRRCAESLCETPSQSIWPFAKSLMPSYVPAGECST